MTLFNDGATVDHLIETDGYRYYFTSDEMRAAVLDTPQNHHGYIMQYAAEVYSKSTGRCLKHRTISAEAANTILRRAGHVEI